MTKIEAIYKVLEDFEGIITLEQIYNNIEDYYPRAKSSKTWKAGIRGVLNRDVRNNNNIERIARATYRLVK